MADFKAQQRVRLNNGATDFGFAAASGLFVRISDGVDTLAIDAQGNVGSVIYTPNGDSAMDETNDAVRVNIVAGSAAATQYAEDSVHVTGDLGMGALVVRQDTLTALAGTTGDYSLLSVDAAGRLYTQISDGGNSITVDGSVTVTATDLDIRDLTHITDSVKIGDGTDFIAINADGSINITDNGGNISIDDGGNIITVDGTVIVTATDLDIRDLTLATDAVRISGNSTANSETNPIFVKNVDTVISGEEVQNYDTSSAIAVDATDNHDYTVAGTTFLLKSIIFAASGAMKIELQTGPVASLVTRAVAFTSGANPTGQLFFDPPIEVPSTSTGTIRIIRRNDDNQAQDVYSTIIGNDV